MQWNVTNRSNNSFLCFSHWFLIQIRNIKISNSEHWFLQRVIEKMTTEWREQFILNQNLENSCNWAIWCSATTYQKVNNSIVSKGTMNSFEEMFLLAVMHTPSTKIFPFLNKPRNRLILFVSFHINFCLAVKKSYFLLLKNVTTCSFYEKYS